MLEMIHTAIANVVSPNLHAFVTQQAYVLSSAGTRRLTAVLCLVLALLVIIMRRARTAAAVAAG
ncbi:MAG: hypothetical protein ABR508_07090 [Candidatus Baltobacteraceae bacterium]